MPPGNVRTKPTIKVIERTTAEACLAIAHRVENARRRVGDAVGADAAREISESIREEVLVGMAWQV
ncbi:MAG TPA: hypothetical protein VJ486_13930 [Geothrix sp.]|nr:hypothetical protein [Geothrix sp.]